MLLYGLEHLRSAGIKEVAIVLGPINEGVKAMVGDGSSLGLNVTYIQQPEPKGLAHAIQLSEHYLKGEPFVMYLGDNLLKQGVLEFVETFNRRSLDCVIGVCPVRDPTRFGNVEVDGDKITKIVEKPKEPKTNLALVGVYVFGPAIFDAVKEIKPSWRNELEITDAIQLLVSQGKRVGVIRVSSWWKDTGRPEDLLEANQLVLSDLEPRIEVDVDQQVQLTGRVAIGKSSKLIGDVRIRGPAIIGERCEIGPNVYVGPYTSIGDECVLKNVEVENSIVMNGSRLECNKRIVDSIIGSYCTILNGDKNLPRGYKVVLGERSFAQF